MPTYDYRCTSCSHRFERRQGFGDDPGAACPVCGAESERVISAVAVHFKGSGFYRTDNSSSRSRGANGAPGDSEKPEKSKKSDSPSAGKKSDSSSSAEKSSSTTGSRAE